MTPGVKVCPYLVRWDNRDSSRAMDDQPHESLPPFAFYKDSLLRYCKAMSCLSPLKWLEAGLNWSDDTNMQL